MKTAPILSLTVAAALAAGLAASALRATPSEIPGSLEALGEALFFDTILSANRTQSCATCHDPHEFKGGPVAEQPEHRLRADNICQVCHEK